MSLNPLGLSFLSSLTLAVILALPQPLFATTLTATNLGDSGMNGQLRTLITLAAPGDTIVIPPGTITLAGPAGEDLNGGGDLDISKNLTIQGAGPGVTIIDGGGIDRVFDVNPFAQTGIEVTISGMTVRNGKPPGDGDGGGIGNASAGTLSLTNVTVSGNTTGGRGGGIGNGGTLTLTNSTVTSNTGLNFGGGVYNLGTMTLTDTTVSGNATLGPNLSGGGGGIFNEGTMTLTGTTVSGNTTLGRAGGIYNLDQTTILVNCTISGNTALNGGGIWNFGGTLTLANTIVSANTAATPSGDCAGVIASLGHNLASDASCAFGGTGDLNNTVPRLGPLQSNGGLTQTHALLPGSLAIDAGDPAGCTDNLGAPLTTHPRGFARPQDGHGDGRAICDLGAYDRCNGIFETRSS